MTENDRLRRLEGAQRTETTEHRIYQQLVAVTNNPHNKEVLERIAQEERTHYEFLKNLTGKEVSPHRFRIGWYYLLARILGLTFSLKLMESGEGNAQESYRELGSWEPAVLKLIPDEDAHEKELIDMIDEDRLLYVGALVLGLNDALVELTGTLAGLTLAFQDTRLIALAGLITGIAASLSMAASEYLSTKSEGGALNPFKASSYTGIAYLVTVFLLIAPYLLLTDYRVSFLATLIFAILVIGIFTYYISVVKDLSFRRRFTEMAAISLGVAFVSFIIGALVRIFLGVGI
ncbi:MAG: VIT1/CCC1 transporter family protein [Methanomicrobiales archaeon]|nr:VIT1/CCC1 transporter family protein [Methanomicrobiales archaeon]